MDVKADNDKKQTKILEDNKDDDDDDIDPSAIDERFWNRRYQLWLNGQTDKRPGPHPDPDCIWNT